MPRAQRGHAVSSRATAIASLLVIGLKVALLGIAPAEGAEAGGEPSPPRGSAEEAAVFQKHALQADRLEAFVPAPAGGELRADLAPGERPSLRFLKPASKAGFKAQGLASPSQPKPSAPPRLLNPLARPPSDFEGEYELEAPSEVTISIVAPNGAILRDARLPAGAPGTRKGKNRLSLWDGQDSLGREAPPGLYRAVIVTHEGGGPRTRIIPIRKGEP